MLLFTLNTYQQYLIRWIFFYLCLFGRTQIKLFEHESVRNIEPCLSSWRSWFSIDILLTDSLCQVQFYSIGLFLFFYFFQLSIEFSCYSINFACMSLHNLLDLGVIILLYLLYVLQWYFVLIILILYLEVIALDSTSTESWVVNIFQGVERLVIRVEGRCLITEGILFRSFSEEMSQSFDQHSVIITPTK